MPALVFLVVVSLRLSQGSLLRPVALLSRCPRMLLGTERKGLA